MPNLEVMIVAAVLRIAEEIYDQVKRGDTKPAVLAQAKRLGIDESFEIQRRLRAARGNQ